MYALADSIQLHNTVKQNSRRKSSDHYYTCLKAMDCFQACVKAVHWQAELVITKNKLRQSVSVHCAVLNESKLFADVFRTFVCRAGLTFDQTILLSSKL